MKVKSGIDYWKLIYSVVSSKSDFEMLKSYMVGPSEIGGEIANAIVEFVFDSSKCHCMSISRYFLDGMVSWSPRLS